MAKKHKSEDDNFENEFYELESEFEEIVCENKEEEEEDEDLSEFDLDDDEDIDIVIEIDEDELDLESETTEEETKSEEDVVLSKHKLEGKHSLKYDSIFKGKKEEVPEEEEGMDSYSSYRKDTIEVDKSSNYHTESIDNESYIRNKLVKERVYVVLKKNTSINFMNNRRKPSKNDFNNYYSLLKTHLEDESFTNIELFNELAVYFSDNLFNMFKLLDNKWRNLIISELEEHVGKNKNSNELTNRNIYEGTEVEFIWEDEFGDYKKITGVVMETYYEISTFKIDSYENIYEVDISKITKILNNTKFKYNLNKLNNIDFL